jgi:hypothetical protein
VRILHSARDSGAVQGRLLRWRKASLLIQHTLAHGLALWLQEHRRCRPHINVTPRPRRRRHGTVDLELQFLVTEF